MGVGYILGRAKRGTSRGIWGNALMPAGCSSGDFGSTAVSLPNPSLVSTAPVQSRIKRNRMLPQISSAAKRIAIPQAKACLFWAVCLCYVDAMRILSQIFSGLRFRLLLLVLLACAPLLALTLHAAWDDRRRQLGAWRQRAQKMTELASREEEALVGGSKQLLLAVSGSAPVRAGSQAGSKLVDELFASYPRYANLGVITTNGEVLASALPLSEPVTRPAASLSDALSIRRRSRWGSSRRRTASAKVRSTLAIRFLTAPGKSRR